MVSRGERVINSFTHFEQYDGGGPTNVSGPVIDAGTFDNEDCCIVDSFRV